MRKAILAASLLLALAQPISGARAEDMTMHPSLSVSGHGEVRQRPDMVTITAGVVSQAGQASAALDANTAAMNKVMAQLKDAGIEPKFIQTSNFSVQARYDYTDNTQPKFTGYEVQNTVAVTLHDLPKLGQVLDALVRAGANQINGIAFDIANPAAAMDEARRLAIADARHRAELYAAGTGATLGPVISLTEGGGGPQPPMPMRASFDKAAASGEVPVSAGENVVSADINVTWSLK